MSIREWIIQHHWDWILIEVGLVLACLTITLWLLVNAPKEPPAVQPPAPEQCYLLGEQGHWTLTPCPEKGKEQ